MKKIRKQCNYGACLVYLHITLLQLHDTTTRTLLPHVHHNSRTTTRAPPLAHHHTYTTTRTPSHAHHHRTPLAHHHSRTYTTTVTYTTRRTPSHVHHYTTTRTPPHVHHHSHHQMYTITRTTATRTLFFIFDARVDFWGQKGTSRFFTVVKTCWGWVEKGERKNGIKPNFLIFIIFCNHLAPVCFGASTFW